MVTNTGVLVTLFNSIWISSGVLYTLTSPKNSSFLIVAFGNVICSTEASSKEKEILSFRDNSQVEQATEQSIYCCPKEQHSNQKLDLLAKGG